MSDDMVQLGNSKCGNNTTIETKDICEKFMEYFMSKREISWQQHQSLKSFKIVFLVTAFSWTKNNLEKRFLSIFLPNFVFVAVIELFSSKILTHLWKNPHFTLLNAKRF